MTRKELIERLMKCNLQSTLTIMPTKGELHRMKDSQLAKLLSLFDVVKNAQYQATRVTFGAL